MGETLDEIVKLLRGALGARFASYRIGRPDLVGKSEMPFLCVFPRQTLSRRSGTGNDDAEYQVSVRCVLDSKPRPNAGPGRNGARAETQRDLVDLVEGRDARGKPRPDTVLGALNANITVGGKVLYTDSFGVAYDTDLSPDGAGRTREYATLTFSCHARPPWRGQ